MNNIEIFPANQTCEQGCPTCPLARKDKAITAMQIDENVQETFSFIESAFKKRRSMYDLHFTSALHLFPIVKHPELIHMSRFETNKDIRVEGNVSLFSSNIQTLLKDNGINPKKIGVSIVPKSPAIDEDDIKVIREIIDAIMQWYFTGEKKRLEITIRTNLIKLELFNQVLPLVFERDFKYLKELIEVYTTLDDYKMLADHSYGTQHYANGFSGTIGKNVLQVFNRVIAESKKNTSVKEMQNQAFSFSPTKKATAHFAIAPKGVMLEHSSVAINNPILWLSHKDFRETFTTRFKKPRLMFGSFSDKLILENACIYDAACKKYGKDKIPIHEFPGIFEASRKR